MPPPRLPGSAFAKAALSAATMPLACVSSVLRSSHGLSSTKKNAMFEEYAPVSRLNPVIVL